MGSGCTITNCAASANGGDGFPCLSGGVFLGCTSSGNSQHGFDIGFSSTISRCFAGENLGNGIFALNDTFILFNSCDANGAGVSDGAGILVTGADNRIEGNNCTDNDRGIDVDAAGTFIVRNSCSGNANNWDVVTGNACLVVNATTSGAINGNAGGVSPGSTDPNANFTY